ncbi:hypothetical protein NtB2_01689 [Lactococcus termiticola]|uniref:Uncharacterized protein n=1 Tax=Lactococcus termiticola TaxID=2169526 RepID=A0A2R5HHS2_9LACT|nr:hypothetical protein NtB2_01689 [Lactococcus termiticola]
MERSLTEEIEENIVQAFFREIYCLKISRGYTLDDNTKERLPELVSYIEMSNEQINYILRKDKEVLNRIFTNETIKLLREVSGNPYFDEEQREQLEELISFLEHRKGVKVPYLKFRLLCSPDEHSPEDIEEITDNLALLLTAPSIFKWFHSEYSFDSLTDKELNEVMGFANLALLNNNQELREKVKRYAIEKLGSKTDLPYSDLLIFFDDLSVQSVIERIFYRK